MVVFEVEQPIRVSAKRQRVRGDRRRYAVRPDDKWRDRLCRHQLSASKIHDDDGVEPFEPLEYPTQGCREVRRLAPLLFDQVSDDFAVSFGAEHVSSREKAVT